MNSFWFVFVLTTYKFSKFLKVFWVLNIFLINIDISIYKVVKLHKFYKHYIYLSVIFVVPTTVLVPSNYLMK